MRFRCERAVLKSLLGGGLTRVSLGGESRNPKPNLPEERELCLHSGLEDQVRDCWARQMAQSLNPIRLGSVDNSCPDQLEYYCRAYRLVHFISHSYCLYTQARSIID
jgi:hypothetical protein